MDSTAQRGPLHAAYFAGRVCNRLSWHAQQTLLLSSVRSLTPERRLQRSSLESSLKELVAVVANCQLDDPAFVSMQLRSAEDRLFSKLDNSNQMFELLDNARNEYQEREYEDDSRAEICSRLVRLEIQPIIDLLIQQIREQYGEDDKAYFDLGRSVDEGIRRPDVCRFMNDNLAPPRLDDRAPLVNDPVQHSGTWEPGGESSASTDCELVDCQINPGELFPQRLWREELTAVWNRAGFDSTQLVPLLERLSIQMGAQGLEDIIVRIEYLVIDRLNELMKRRPPSQFKHGPVNCKIADVEAAIASGKRHFVERRRWSPEKPEGTLWYYDDGSGNYLRDFYFLREQDFEAVNQHVHKR